MKPFCVIDENKPMQFFMNCTGCVLEPQKHDRVVVITGEGRAHEVGVQLRHDLSVHLYDKILEAAKCGGTLVIPKLDGLDDDEVREILGELKVQ